MGALHQLVQHAVGLGDLDQVLALLDEEHDVMQQQQEHVTRTAAAAAAAASRASPTRSAPERPPPSIEGARLSALLLERFAPNGTTLLHTAARLGSERTVGALFELARALPDGRRVRRDMLERREDAQVGGFTPLHAACERGHAEVARQLLEHGADAQAREAGARYTCLHVAVRAGHLRVARLLASSGADLNARDAFGNNAAFWAKELRLVGAQGAQGVQGAQGRWRGQEEGGLLGPPRCASIEERFLAVHRRRVKNGLDVSRLEAPPRNHAPTYTAFVKAKPKGKGKGKGKSSKGKKGKKR